MSLRWRAVVTGALAAIVVAGVGGTLTRIGVWYHSLVVPAWKPPDWAFGPIWTVILTLTVIAGVRAYLSEKTVAVRKTMIALFALNGLLNVLWTLLFFTLHRPDWALIEVGVFWLSILALIVILFRRAPVSSALLAPYIIWVSIASVLNYQIVLLNSPFK